MEDRTLSRASWVAFGAFSGVLYLITICSGDSGNDQQSEPAATEA